MVDFNELMAEIIAAGGDRVAVIEAFIKKVEGLRDFDLVWSLFAEARGLVAGRLYDRLVWERSKGVALHVTGASGPPASAPNINSKDTGDGSKKPLEVRPAPVASPVEDEDGGSKTHLKTRLPVAAPSSVPPVVRAAAKTLVRYGLEARGAESAGRAMRRLHKARLVLDRYTNNLGTPFSKLTRVGFERASKEETPLMRIFAGLLMEEMPQTSRPQDIARRYISNELAEELLQKAKERLQEEMPSAAD